MNRVLTDVSKFVQKKRSTFIDWYLSFMNKTANYDIMIILIFLWEMFKCLKLKELK